MQQVKMYTPGMFKGEARQQFWKDIKKMEKNGWRVHTVTDTEAGRDIFLRIWFTAIYER